MAKITEPSERIYFFTPFCILRNSTNRIFDMRMCDAFAGAGTKTTMIFPYFYMKENLKRDDIFKSYDCKNTFGLRIQWTPLTSKTPDLLRTLILLIAFSISTLRLIIGNTGRLRNVVVISREVIPLIPIIVIKKIFGRLIPVKIVIQLHELKKSRLHRWAYRQCTGLMPNVPIARTILHERDSIPNEKMLIMNAPMVDFLPTDCSKQQAREKIGYKANAPLVVYTGKVGKGIAELDYILEAAAMLPQYHFIFTGGKEHVVKFFREYCEGRKINNTTFTGFFNEVSMVRYYQLAADVLVSYYNTGDHLVDFNYPQKIQEYLSTGNAIVTPDFSATREVINEGNSFIVEPDDPKALANGISDAIENKELAKTKGAAAILSSKKITYDSKVAEFLDFFKKLS